MAGSFAVGLPPDIQPTRAALVGVCESATSGDSRLHRAIGKRNAARLGFIGRPLSMLIANSCSSVGRPWQRLPRTTGPILVSARGNDRAFHDPRRPWTASRPTRVVER